MYKASIPPIPAIEDESRESRERAFASHLDHLQHEKDESERLYHALNKAFQIVDACASDMELWAMRGEAHNGDQYTTREFANRIRQMRDEAEHAVSLVRAALKADIEDVGPVIGWTRDDVSTACTELAAGQHSPSAKRH